MVRQGTAYCALCKTYTTYHCGCRREQRPEGHISEAGEGFLLPVSVQQSGYFPVFCPPPDPCAPTPNKGEVGGVFLHTQKLHKSIWQDAYGVGSRGGLELRSSYLSVSPSFNHQVAISRGAKGVSVGKHGTLLRTVTQMDPWTGPSVACS